MKKKEKRGGKKDDLFKKYILFIYSFMIDREGEKGRDTGRGRSRLNAGSLMRDLIPGLQGSRPGPKAGAKPLSYPGIPS